MNISHWLHWATLPLANLLPIKLVLSLVAVACLLSYVGWDRRPQACENVPTLATPTRDLHSDSQEIKHGLPGSIDKIDSLITHSQDVFRSMPLDYASYQVDLHQPEVAIVTLERGRASIGQLLEGDPDLGHVCSGQPRPGAHQVYPTELQIKMMTELTASGRWSNLVITC